jgi:hypothetical protein
MASCLICRKNTSGRILLSFKSTKKTSPVHKKCWDKRVKNVNTLPCYYCGLDISLLEPLVGFRDVFNKKTGTSEYGYPFHELCSVKMDLMFESMPDVKYEDGAWYLKYNKNIHKKRGVLKKYKNLFSK